LVVGALLILVVGCAVDEPAITPSPTATASPTPTRTLRPPPTITPTPTVTPTATPRPYPQPIEQDNLTQLSLLYRFNSLGFYSPENNWLVLYDNQQTAIWDLRSGVILATFIGRYKAIHGDYLLTTTGADLLLWRVSDGQQLLDFPALQGKFHPNQPWLIVFSTQTGMAQLWDYQAGELLSDIPEYPDDHFAFSPEGGLLAASGGEEMLVRVWALPGMELLHEFDRHVLVANNNTRVAITTDERFLLVSGTLEQKIFDLHTGELVRVDSEAWAIFPGPDPRHVFVISEATTRIYDLQAQAFLNRYLLGDTPAFFPEAGLITNHDANVQGFHLYVYHSETFEQLATLHLRRGVTGNGSFLDGADLFATADQSGILRFFDVNTWEQIYQLEGMDDFYIVRPEFSQGGHWLLFNWYTYDEHGDYYNGFDVWGIPQ
jgi:WD40 repeat protein